MVMHDDDNNTDDVEEEDDDDGYMLMMNVRVMNGFRNDFSCKPLSILF